MKQPRQKQNGIAPKKDRQTVTPEGKPLEEGIDGLIVRRAPPIEDKRGEVVEVFRPSWGVHPDPLVYVYQVGIRPGAVKGWTLHEKQDDRIFHSRGTVRWAFFDHRKGSHTYGKFTTITVSERSRALIIIPRGVFHAVQNIGSDEASFINMPTRPYDHADPDKYRLALKNDLIPFGFDDGAGW